MQDQASQYASTLRSILHQSPLALCLEEATSKFPEKFAIVSGGQHLPYRALDHEARRLAQVAPDDPAIILYTSGTTAHPKDVTHSHRTALCGRSRGWLRKL